MHSAEALTPEEYEPVNRRTVQITGLAILVGIAAGFVAQVLLHLINFVTNLAFFGRLAAGLAAPADHHLGWWVIGIPVLGAIVVGVMARYGSAAIRGHGIPEVMERVLQGESRIPARVMLLKPLSAAVAIGTGGPFGAEGPIIATGGALGSFLGQTLHITADERKTLLAPAPLPACRPRSGARCRPCCSRWSCSCSSTGLAPSSPWRWPPWRRPAFA